MADIPPTRASLLLRLRDPRDGEAWGQFVDLYAPLVYGYLRKQGLQDADAADLCQDVLAAVAGAVGRLEYDPAKGAFRNWLFTVVRRKLSNWRRGQGNRPDGGDDAAGRLVLEQCPGPAAGEAEWEAEWRERVFAWACEQVRRDVADVAWQAFSRTALQGESCKQVAAELGVNVAAIYLARSRVLARLRELVQSVREP
jgi:RNA polymerase sigma-70 factor (ECF subfamily)